MIHGNWKPTHGSLLGERLHRDGIWAVMLLHAQDEGVVQWLSHVQVCDPMDYSMPGFPVNHQLLELAQTHVH